ncbi:MFS general substrate transporter [Naviculisporaceae sp. PSN 640]
MATTRLERSEGPKKKDTVGWLDLPNKDQLFILSLCRLSEPLSNVCLLPYIFYLVRSALATAQNGEKSHGAATAAEISTYSGILVASFSLAQFVASLPWGRLSDSYGRRFSVVVGIAISVVSNAAFGFSRSFGALLFWRSVAGLANANVGIMRTMTAEIVGPDRKFQTKAFLLLPLVFNSGMVLSLALGGLLAEPAVNLPWLVGPTVQWAIDYPYALPAVFNAAMLLFALLLALFFLRETLAGKEEEKDIGLRIGHGIMTFFARQKASYQRLRDSEDVNLDSPHIAQRVGLDEAQGGKEADPVMGDVPLGGPATRTKPSLRSIFTFRTVAALVSFGLLPLHNSTFMHIFPVYLSTPPDQVPHEHISLLAFTGGLGLRSASIGIWLSVFGIGGILLQLFIYPRMQARIGTLGVFKISLIMFPLIYLLAPYLSLLPDTGPLSFLRWLGLGIIICGQIMARTMAIPSTVILLTEAAPAKNVLGTVHGAGNMLACLARAVGPAVGGAVYSIGVNEGVIGAVWWFYLVIVAAVAAAWCFGVQGRAERRGNSYRPCSV